MQEILSLHALLNAPFSLQFDLHQNGSTALMLSAESGFKDVVRLLLDCGADIHASTDVSNPLAPPALLSW